MTKFIVGSSCSYYICENKIKRFSVIKLSQTSQRRIYVFLIYKRLSIRVEIL
jgi:hypothetical protein